MPTRTHVHEEVLPAPPERLFALLVAPSDIRGWWSAARAIVVPRAGGIWSAAWGADEDAPDYVTTARIQAFEPSRRLMLGEYDYVARTGPLPFKADFQTEFTIAPTGGCATLRVVQAGFPSGPEADDFYAACRRGWAETFTAIRRWLAAEATARPISPDATADFTRFIDDIALEFHRHRRLVDKALQEIDDAIFFRQPGTSINSIAVILKHLSGSMRSRWTDFGRSDGEKPDRNRDGEFVISAADTRDAILRSWHDAWLALDDTLAMLKADPRHWSTSTTTIRGELHTVSQALLRGAGHVAYHTGQILYLVRWMKPGATWQTIAPGATASGAYRTEP